MERPLISWRGATKRYIASRKPGFVPQKKAQMMAEPPPTLMEFLKSSMGKDALKLLEAAGEAILLGRLEDEMIYLTGRGCATDRTPTTAQKKGPKAATNFLEKLPPEWVIGRKGFKYIVWAMKDALNEIAEKAP